MLAQKENGKGVGGECVPEEMFGLPSRRPPATLPKGHVASRRRLTCWAGMWFVGNILRLGSDRGGAVATGGRDAHHSAGEFTSCRLVEAYTPRRGGHRLLLTANGPSTVVSPGLFMLIPAHPVAQLNQPPPIGWAEGPQGAG